MFGTRFCVKRVCFRPFRRSFSPLLCCSAVFSLQFADFHHRLKEIQFSGRLRKEQQKLVEVNKGERRPGGAKSSGLRLAASFISEASQLRPLSLIVGRMFSTGRTWLMLV